MSPFALSVVALASIITAAAAVLAFLISAEVVLLQSVWVFLAKPAGKATLYALGALLVAISMHYALLFFRGRARLAHFSQDGQWGKIELSPYALRELVSGIMREEIGIERFKAKLGHLDNGLSIKITTTLSPEDKVAEIGQRIQDTLSARVTERTGVEVNQVSVLVSSIQPQKHESDIEGEAENEHPATS